MLDIQMVDLQGQYLQIKQEIDEAIQSILNSSRFIKGPQVQQFEMNLSAYLRGSKVISCANGTDALQIAMMALDINPGDEIIVPAFTYVATAEVIALLGLTPVMVDVDLATFNIDIESLAGAITSKTKAIVPVHLYGQCSNMEAIMNIANQHDLYIIEDNAQAIGASHVSSDGQVQKTGTLGHIGCTSFFPSKNLGCYGDGGALYTSDTQLANKIQMISNHGQKIKYHHDIVGINSRLDAIQAAVLNVKLKYLDAYSKSRQEAAAYYDQSLMDVNEITIPERANYSTHVYHQYTLRIKNNLRNDLKKHLTSHGIPSMIYYPLPLYRQKAYEMYAPETHLKNTEQLCQEVLSLPIHTEMSEEKLKYICKHIHTFFSKMN